LLLKLSNGARYWRLGKNACKRVTAKVRKKLKNAQSSSRPLHAVHAVLGGVLAVHGLGVADALMIAFESRSYSIMARL